VAFVTHFRLTRTGTACVAVLLAALCCAGCGRRGRLDLPPDSTAAATPATGSQPMRQHRMRQPPPPKDFILDPLI
jgi:predicted small lipoprotein YifL